MKISFLNSGGGFGQLFDYRCRVFFIGVITIITLFPYLGARDGFLHVVWYGNAGGGPGSGGSYHGLFTAKFFVTLLLTCCSLAAL